ncbi:MAG: RluA family pseudouridine synthase [Candidatus Eisenbacteria bacterium]|nr:RluA family pseudouridine synthase [Candidatus Eisenbacteria bacterium]
MSDGDSGAKEAGRIRVPPEAAGERLDRFLTRHLADASREQVRRLIRDGRVTLDARPAKPSARVEAGQIVAHPGLPPAPPLRIEPQEIPLQIVYEDEDLLVVNKPAGLVVHPGAGVRGGTLVNALRHHWPGWPGVGGADRPGVVHRLDRGTSGLMVVARSRRAYRSLVTQVGERTVGRRYVALAWGCPRERAGLVEAPVGRDPRRRQRMAVRRRGGRTAATEFELLRAFDTLCLMRLTLRTGRTHQIRVHLSHLGHPVFCDPTYGGGRRYAARLSPRDRARAMRWLKMLGRPALHAYHLAFDHPHDAERMVFEAPVPDDMEKVLSELEAAMERTGGDR